MSAALAPLTPAPLPHLINEPQVMADGHGLIRQADHQSTSRSRAIRQHSAPQRVCYRWLCDRPLAPHWCWHFRDFPPLVSFTFLHNRRLVCRDLLDLAVPGQAWVAGCGIRLSIFDAALARLSRHLDSHFNSKTEGRQNHGGGDNRRDYGPMRNGRCSPALHTTQRMVIVPSRLIELVSVGVQHEWNPGISGSVITLPARIHCRINDLLNNRSY